MAIFLSKASETNDQIPGLRISPPVQITPTGFSVGVRLYVDGKPYDVCSSADERRGWRFGKEFYGHVRASN